MGKRPLHKFRAALGGGAVALVLFSCSSNKNHEERALVATAKPERCIDQCQPDPGPAPVDCEAAELNGDYEYVKLFDFEGGVASNLYIYDDSSVCEEWWVCQLSATAFQACTPGSTCFDGTPCRDMSACDDYASFRFPTNGYQPPTFPAVRCGVRNAEGELVGVESDALHIWGGPFLGWGGGFGRRLDGLLPPAPDAEFPTFSIDVSEYEGFAFWARRGPDGQPGLRVSLGDKRTDDDISFQSYVMDPDKPRYCERTRECGCRSKPCSPHVLDGRTSYYCWDPATDPEPVVVGDKAQYDRCGETECNAPYSAFPNQMDTQFLNKPCTEHEFRGSVTGMYCFDPATDPPPAEGTQTCGDHWMKSVHLTTEWQFFRVPFTELLQQGWAKEQHFLNLREASMMRFSFDRGWIDYWIDDVSFYRRRTTAP